MKIELLDKSDTPDWFAYPTDFIQAIDEGLYDIGAWQILEGKWLKVRFDGMKKRFPELDLVPFARRVDSDDVACWARDTYPHIQIIHDFCTPGWEKRETYPCFQSWRKAAEEDEEGEDDGPG